MIVHVGLVQLGIVDEKVLITIGAGIVICYLYQDLPSPVLFGHPKSPLSRGL